MEEGLFNTKMNSTDMGQDNSGDCDISSIHNSNDVTFNEADNGGMGDLLQTGSGGHGNMGNDSDSFTDKNENYMDETTKESNKICEQNTADIDGVNECERGDHTNNGTEFQMNSSNMGEEINKIHADELISSDGNPIRIDSDMKKDDISQVVTSYVSGDKISGKKGEALSFKNSGTVNIQEDITKVGMNENNTERLTVDPKQAINGILENNAREKEVIRNGDTIMNIEDVTNTSNSKEQINPLGSDRNEMINNLEGNSELSNNTTFDKVGEPTPGDDDVKSGKDEGTIQMDYSYKNDNSDNLGHELGELTQESEVKGGKDEGPFQVDHTTDYKEAHKEDLGGNKVVELTQETGVKNCQGEGTIQIDYKTNDNEAIKDNCGDELADITLGSEVKNGKDEGTMQMDYRTGDTDNKVGELSPESEVKDGKDEGIVHMNYRTGDTDNKVGELSPESKVIAGKDEGIVQMDYRTSDKDNEVRELSPEPKVKDGKDECTAQMDYRTGDTDNEVGELSSDSKVKDGKDEGIDQMDYRTDDKDNEVRELSPQPNIKDGKDDGTVQMDYRTGDKDANKNGSSGEESDESDESSDDDDNTNQDAAKTINKSVGSNRDLSPERKVKLNRHGFEDMRTKGEIMPEELPPLEELTITVDETVEMIEVGTVASVVGVLVIVQAGDNVPPLNDDTILFVEGHKVLGQVFEVFGPVKTPWYSVRFNDSANIEAKGIQPGTKVFCAPKEESFTKFVFVDSIKKIRGSDASWEDNNEPPDKHLDYSDDEEEKRAKAKRKSDRKAKIQGTDGATEGVKGTDTGVQQKKGKWQSWPPRDDSQRRPNYHQDHRRDQKNQWATPGPEQNFQTRYHRPSRMTAPPQNDHSPMGPNTTRFRGPPPRFGGPPNFQNQQRFQYQNNQACNGNTNEQFGGFNGNQQNYNTNHNRFSQQQQDNRESDFSRPPPLFSPPNRFGPPPPNMTNIPNSQPQQPNRMPLMQDNRNNMMNDSVQGGRFPTPNQQNQMMGPSEAFSGRPAPFGFDSVPRRQFSSFDGPVQQPMSFNNNNSRPVGPDNYTNVGMNVFSQGNEFQANMNYAGHQKNMRDNLGQEPFGMKSNQGDMRDTNNSGQRQVRMTNMRGMEPSSHGQVPGNKPDMAGQFPSRNLPGNQQPFMAGNNQQQGSPFMPGPLNNNMNHVQFPPPTNQADRMNQGLHMTGNQPQNINQEQVMLQNNQSFSVNQVPHPPNMMQGNQSLRMNQEQPFIGGNQSDRIHRGPHSGPFNPPHNMTGGPGMVQGSQSELRINQGQGSGIQGESHFNQGPGTFQHNDIQHDPRHMPLNNRNTQSGPFGNMATYGGQNNLNMERNRKIGSNEQPFTETYRNDRNAKYMNDNRNTNQSICKGPQQNGDINDPRFMGKNFHNNSQQYNEPRLIEDPRLMQGR